MAAGAGKIKIGGRAIFALLLLLAGWLAPALTLAGPVPVECGMSCCLTSGHCCCLDRLREHERENPDADDPPQLARARENCPPGCATAPQSAHTLFAARTQPAIPGEETDLSRPELPGHADHVREELLLRNTAPRAPPFSFINCTA